MGSRDYRRREPKKPKKEARKPVAVPIVLPAAMVEVIKTKGKKEKSAAEETGE